ncbi:MAG: STAS domain-containing protein [Fibrobacteria bacterium]|nr:STAS domain-containing protein [Fibrobacteria bacterium]
MDSFWEIEQENYGFVLTLLRDWDIDRVNEFSNFVNENVRLGKPQNFIIDLKNVNYIDSTIITVLLSIFKQVKKSGGDFFILNPCDTVLTTFQKAGLSGFFKVLNADVDLKTQIRYIEDTKNH